MLLLIVLPFLLSNTEKHSTGEEAGQVHAGHCNGYAVPLRERTSAQGKLYMLYTDHTIIF